MNNRIVFDKNKQVRIGLYSSSQGISMIALIIVAVFEVMMLGFSVINSELYGPYLLNYRLFYASLLAVAIVYIALNVYAKKDIDNRYALLSVANPVCAIFFYGWALGITYFDAMIYGTIDPTVFMTFSMVVPLIFALLPSFYAVTVILADALMLYLIVSVTGAGVSIINVIVFFVFQFVLGIGFLRLKISLSERIVQEEENARIDVMTDLLNRRVYEEDLKHIKQEPLPKDLFYVVIDINGLKDVNDNHGHEAGDRLIIGAARCIEESFKDRGRLYRIGGDEFVVLLDANQEEVERLTDDVKQRAATWSDKEDVKLTISCGAAGAPEFPEDDISELARTADERMYHEKARYYQSIGMERRRRRIKAADAGEGV